LNFVISIVTTCSEFEQHFWFWASNWWQLVVLYYFVLFMYKQCLVFQYFCLDEGVCYIMGNSKEWIIKRLSENGDNIFQKAKI